MGNRNKVMTLPAEIRRQLDDKLRAANYGDLIELSSWVTAKAFPVSKSGLQRYALGLRAHDLARGIEDAERLSAIQNAGEKTGEALEGRKAKLLLRLAGIELERARILKELAPMLIGESGMWDEPTSSDGTAARLN